MDISKTVADLRQRIPFLTPRISGERKLEIIPLDPVAAAAIEKNNYLLKYAEVVTCNRRRQTPSVKRPEYLVAPEQKCTGR